jgi:hypothetical protein
MEVDQGAVRSSAAMAIPQETGANRAPLALFPTRLRGGFESCIVCAVSEPCRSPPFISITCHRDEPREHHKGHGKVPETKNTEEGSSKRNITRKHDHNPNRCVV